MLGHTSWQVTVCVPKEAETLETPTNEEDESQRVARRRRNDCYQIAYCYLKVTFNSIYIYLIFAQV